MPNKNAKSYPIFPKQGVLTRDDDPNFAQAISGAASTEGALMVLMPNLSPITFPTDQVTVSQSTGRLSFISSNTPYRIRELREDDGEWMSKYKTLLPLAALESINNVSTSGDMVPIDTDLTAPDETLDAYSMDDSAYVVGVVYTNTSGVWLRTDGDWLLLAPNDNTFENLIATPIDPDKADGFLDFYDNNFVTVSDLEQYEAKDLSTSEQ